MTSNLLTFLAIGFEDLVFSKGNISKDNNFNNMRKLFCVNGIWFVYDSYAFIFCLQVISQKTQSFFVESEGRGLLSTISILKPVLKWVIVWFLLFI